MFEIRDGQLVFTTAGLPSGGHHLAATIWNDGSVGIYVDGRRYPPLAEEA